MCNSIFGSRKPSNFEFDYGFPPRNTNGEEDLFFKIDEKDKYNSSSLTRFIGRMFLLLDETGIGKIPFHCGENINMFVWTM